jgi:acyl carrier protein
MEDDIRQRIWKALEESIENLLSEQGRSSGPIMRDTLISEDLGLISMDFVHLLLALEEKLGQTFEFEKVALRDGVYRADLTVGDLADFMAEADYETGLSSFVDAT